MRGEKGPGEGWLSVHVYHAGQLDRLLREAVAPLVRRLRESGGEVELFFVRYAEGGPHLRLRLRSAAGAPVVEPAVVAEMERYLARHPSARDDDAAASDPRTGSTLLPNDTVRAEPYVPETERYGGPEGMRLAERHFHASSAAVLGALEEKEDGWSYERAMGTAIQMHLALAFGLGMTPAHAAALFARLTDTFLPHAVADLAGSAFLRLAPGQHQALLARFAGAMEPVRVRMVDHHREVWSALATGGGFGQEWLDRWTADAGASAAQLRRADAEGRLHYPAWWFELHPDVENAPGERLIFILASLFHMTNNRLGILNRDEAYLAYVLASSLASLARSG